MMNENAPKEAPAWVWKIAVSFDKLAKGREAEITQAIDSWQGWEIGQLRAQKKQERNIRKPPKTTKTFALRQASREKRRVDNPMPQSAVFGRAVAVVAGTLNKVIEKTPADIVETSGLCRMSHADGLRGVLLASVCPVDFEAERRRIEGAWQLVADRWSDTQQSADGMSAAAVADKALPAMLPIPEAARYARVTTNTIRNWIKTMTGTEPMLLGVIGKGRLTRIPKTSLDHYRKTPAQKKVVKRDL